MRTYTPETTLKIAKRFNNPKRTYLLVNPLQGKHMPVSPSESLAMMWALGDKLAEQYPQTKLVIGFAETATAVGAAVASRFGPDCVYLPTTREAVPSVLDWVMFSEEHSHAVEQKLAGDNLAEWIAHTSTIIFVDDEISTGKTLINMIRQLKARCPGLGDKKLVAASLLNRVSRENEQKMLDAGIRCEYLVKLPETDYTAAVEDIQIQQAEAAPPADGRFAYQALFCDGFLEVRKGVYIRSYIRSCSQMVQTFLAQFAYQLEQGSSILVLGTEECMYPALTLGKALEEFDCGFTVRCHATTRSPIGISHAQGYPITSGRRIQSFFAPERETYIYDLSRYDVVIVVSDTPSKDLEALKSLMGAMQPLDRTRLYYVQGGRNVWYL